MESIGRRSLQTCSDPQHHEFPQEISRQLTAGSESIIVTWSPVPFEDRRGIIRKHIVKYYQENDRLKSYEIDVPGNTTTRVELLQLKKYTNYEDTGFGCHHSCEHMEQRNLCEDSRGWWVLIYSNILN